MDAVPPWIFLPYNETILVRDDVVGGPRVREPGGIAKDGRGRSSSKSRHLGVLRPKGMVVTALPDKMPRAAIGLALDTVVTAAKVITVVIVGVKTGGSRVEGLELCV